MKNNQPNSNICLKFDPSTAAVFEHIAQSSFQESAFGYCLGNGIAFPHITLSQLHVTDAGQKADIDQWLDEKKFKIPVTLDNFNISFHSPGVMWCHFSVHKSAALTALQAEIHHFVKTIGLAPLNPSLDAYHPHVTIARLKAGTPIPSFQIPEELIDQEFATEVIYGPSDEVGQLLGYAFDE